MLTPLSYVPQHKIPVEGLPGLFPHTRSPEKCADVSAPCSCWRSSGTKDAGTTTCICPSPVVVDFSVWYSSPSNSVHSFLRLAEDPWQNLWGGIVEPVPTKPALYWCLSPHVAKSSIPCRCHNEKGRNVVRLWQMTVWHPHQGICLSVFVTVVPKSSNIVTSVPSITNLNKRGVRGVHHGPSLQPLKRYHAAGDPWSEKLLFVVMVIVNILLPCQETQPVLLWFLVTSLMSSLTGAPSPWWLRGRRYALVQTMALWRLRPLS